MNFSIFGTPRPFVGKADIHQRNAIKSWTLHSDDVLLFDAPEHIAHELGTRHISGVRRNDIGLPYIDEMFRIAQILAEYDLMAYVNADVVLGYGLGEALGRAAARFDRFLLCGQRYDVDLDEPLDFSQDWRIILERIIAMCGVLHSVSGKDWFGFRRPFPIDLPPFVVGRAMWDNYVLDAHLKAGVPVIDATQVVTVAHPNHEIAEGRLGGRWHDYNMALGNVPSNQGRISEATWEMTPDDIVRR
jgi:hypothetical protein